MVTPNQLAHHVYHTFPGPEQPESYAVLDFLAQLNSVLHWQRVGGPMRLVCDEAFAEKAERWNLTGAYEDGIDTETLKSMPSVDGRYWAFAKVFLLRQLSQIEPNRAHVLMDTDFWLTQRPALLDAPATESLIGFHREAFDEQYVFNPYLPPQLLLPDLATFPALDWSVLPLNTAFLRVQHPALITDWYEWALRVVNVGKQVPPLGESREIVFLEQRLLPTLAAHHGIPVETLLGTTFQTAPGEPDESPWDNPKRAAQGLTTMKHVWSTKSGYANPVVRLKLARLLHKELSTYFTDTELKPYRELLAAGRDLEREARAEVKATV